MGSVDGELIQHMSRFFPSQRVISGLLIFLSLSALYLYAFPQTNLFSGLKIIVVPDGEDGAANFLRVNDVVFVADRFPRTLDLLRKEGFDAKGLPATEVAKLDAGLSCMSLRWSKM